METATVDVRTWSFAGPVAQRYELTNAPVATIVGPTGGGKSTASARRCLRVAASQHPSPRDRIRKGRIVVICPTYRRAWDTVMPSYFKVLPQSLGTFRGARGDPADHIFDLPIQIGGKTEQLHVEVLFRAVQDLDLEEFFRGLEVTAFWLPEMDTNDSDAILSFASNRVGRYPEPDDRPDDLPPAYAGVFGDANAPLIGGWFHKRFYLKRMPDGSPAPATDRLFIQPGGRSPKAENLSNLKKIRPDYYAHMASQLGSTEATRLVDNKPGYGRHGQPVQPDFDPVWHVAAREVPVDPHQPVIIGVDCGSNALIPGAGFLQRSYSGQWRMLAEIHLEDGQMGTPELAKEIRRIFETRCKGATGAVMGLDPAAAGGNALSEFTTAQALQAWTGIEAQLAPTNDPKMRRDALVSVLKRTAGPGEPAFIVDPSCVGTIAGLSGGWHYPKRGHAVSPTPAKNRYSHVCEAVEYAIMVGEGVDGMGGRFIRPDGTGGDAPPKVIND